MPAFTAILPAYAPSGGIDLTISAWHGFTPELFMTIGVIVVGALNVSIHSENGLAFIVITQKLLTLNNLYNEGLNKMESFSFGLTNRI